MSDEQARRAAKQVGSHAEARLPGVWQAGIIAALSALLTGYIVSRGSARDVSGPANVSQLAEVSEADVPGALATVDAPRDQLAPFNERRACSHRLAWVSVARQPGQPSGRIRLQSGNYLSPAFDLTDVPVRVALPYPARYATGRGTIGVLGATVDAVVALSPPWHVPAQQGWHARDVTWTPVGDCPAPAK